MNDYRVITAGICAKMLKYRRKKLRRVVTAQPEPFTHGLQDSCT
jgi:hypothetical protein